MPPEQLMRDVVPSDGLMNLVGNLFVRHGWPSRRTIESLGRRPMPLTCNMYLPVDVRTTRQDVSEMFVAGLVASTHVNVTSYPNAFG